MELFAGLEKRDVLLVNLDAFAGARVAARAGLAVLDRKGAKPAKLDPIASALVIWSKTVVMICSASL